MKEEIDSIEKMITIGIANVSDMRRRDELARNIAIVERLPPVFETIQTKQCRKV